MKPSMSKCPVCSSELTVTRLRCDACDTTIEGRFSNNALPGLNEEQLDFVETFVRCEGKITRVEDELGLSYPTIRNRLQEVIRAMGYEPGKDEEEEGPEISDEKRRSILEELDAGKISADEAMRLLHGEEE
jgi:hypothetical protein